jgi:hypothetical protein
MASNPCFLIGYRNDDPVILVRHQNDTVKEVVTFKQEEVKGLMNSIGVSTQKIVQHNEIYVCEVGDLTKFARNGTWDCVPIHNLLTQSIEAVDNVPRFDPKTKSNIPNSSRPFNCSVLQEFVNWKKEEEEKKEKMKSSFCLEEQFGGMTVAPLSPAEVLKKDLLTAVNWMVTGSYQPYIFLSDDVARLARSIKTNNATDILQEVRDKMKCIEPPSNCVTETQALYKCLDRVTAFLQ